jgi:mannose-6-phosphate isomerase-like protein (cupin superfamily)
VLEAGDCVLQPPGIRHRVLEASAGLEVIEVGCPAVHATCVDHDLALPTASVLPERRFGGQRFVRHRAARAHWSPWHGVGCEACDTGIAAATDGLAAVRVVRCRAPPEPGARDAARVHAGEFLFLFVLRGELALRGPALGDHRLLTGDCCVLPRGAHYSLEPGAGMELLEVKLPAEAGTE